MTRERVRSILSLLVIFCTFFVLVFTLLFGSFSSFGGNPLVPERYFMPFVIVAIVIFSVIVIFSIHYVQEKTSNPDPILNSGDYNGANSLHVMATGATIASLTFTIYVITQKGLGLGFLRILIIPALSSSVISALAFIIRRFRPELLFTSVLLLLAVFIMFVPILSQFF